MSETPNKNEELQKKTEEIMKRMSEIMENAKNDGIAEPFTKPIQVTQNLLTIKPNDATTKTDVKVFQSGTELDNFFLDSDGKQRQGIPISAQIGIVGLPDSGKSILVQKIALKMANYNKKVLFIPNEDIWSTDNARFDLQSRMKLLANALGLDWEKIKENLYVFDTITHSQLRDWETLVSTYRYLVEHEKIEVLIIDSLTLLEDYRGALKSRLAEFIRYNQLHGITAFYVSQRSTEEADQFGMAGGISLSHLLDTVFALDYKKLSSWDATIKQDTNAKQGETIRFIRCLKNRMGRFDSRYWRVTISKDGEITLVEPSMVNTEKPL